MASNTTTNHVLFHVNNELGRVFSWASIGLAVLTAFLQGLVTAMASMTEASTRWTFRFRLSLVEHWWWTAVSVLLLVSLGMNALAFASGNGGEPISVLSLSAFTFIAIVRYTLPAWQNRHYMQTRWWAWTGDSRTAIHRETAGFCGNSKGWRRLVKKHKTALSKIQRTNSDFYGWRLWPVPGIEWDPTDVLIVLGSKAPDLHLEEGNRGFLIYDDGNNNSSKVSLRWGRPQEFRRRVSRAVCSVPLGLLQCSPVTTDGYDGKGLTLAMGILGRNKGLEPRRLVFEMTGEISSRMENLSTWHPRPSKVLRSFYKKTLEGQYGGLGDAFVQAACELALLMQDMPHWAINKWLAESIEHQCLDTNQYLATKVLTSVPPEERKAALAAHYESSYVSMIISLNNMHGGMKDKRNKEEVVARPDLMCIGLLLKRRGYPEPSWWNWPDVADRRIHQCRFLPNESHWKQPMAQLLGLERWPEGFEEHPVSRWGEPLPAPTPPPVLTAEEVSVSGVDSTASTSVPAAGNSRGSSSMRGTNDRVAATENGDIELRVLGSTTHSQMQDAHDPEARIPRAGRQEVVDTDAHQYNRPQSP